VFLVVLGFRGFFFFIMFFMPFLYTSCMLGSTYTFYKAFLILPIKKKKKQTLVQKVILGFHSVVVAVFSFTKAADIKE
jgi:hypothetical protein